MKPVSSTQSIKSKLSDANKGNLFGSGNVTMEQLFGFRGDDFRDWKSFVMLLNRSTDPSSLGVLRCVFGLLMFLDVFHERGLHMVDYSFGDPEECRFPLFNILRPLPLQWMYIVYLCMMLGALGIMLGLFFKLSCLLFLLTYWYTFLLDKTLWNNHSYLYGLCSVLLLLSDANRYWSIDGLLKRPLRNSHVPLWNYTLLRVQFFLVYFVAGLKKLDYDWVHGYSMNRLSSHWVFHPFTKVMSPDAVDLWIVHRGGLTIDLTIGYLLFFDYTRPLGIAMGLSFHFMNSQMFMIGMFPYTMLATMPIFFHVDWPKKLPNFFSKIFTKDSAARNDNCLYPGDSPSKKKEKKRHHLYSIIVIMYIAIQCFLPYSHFLTKGYNNWTNGLYGYSWDMMIHTWSTQHIRITYVDNESGKQGYLNPEAWTRGSDRWSSHTDMIKQHATCIKDRLKHYGLHNVSLHFDIWKSLNDRFQQRMVDPRVDVVTAPWHPLQETPWKMPLLTDLSDWRGKLDEIEKDLYFNNNMTEVVFIADMPGLQLENYIHKDLGNTTLHVLHGQVIVELLSDKHNTSLAAGQKIRLSVEQYHKVYTVSEKPSCFMYIFINTTEVDIAKKLKQAETNDGTDLKGDLKDIYNKVQKTKQEVQQKMKENWLTAIKKFLMEKYRNVYRGLTMMKIAVHSIVTQETFEEVFNKTILYQNKDVEHIHDEM